MHTYGEKGLLVFRVVVQGKLGEEVSQRKGWERMKWKSDENCGISYPRLRFRLEIRETKGREHAGEGFL